MRLTAHQLNFASERVQEFASVVVGSFRIVFQTQEQEKLSHTF